MLVIDKKSKKGHFYIRRFGSKIALQSLSECYSSYSFAKLSAYNKCYCIVEKYANDSKSDVTRIVEDWGVLSYNNYLFTFGARIFCHDEDFDIQYYEYIVITKSYMYLIK